MKFRDSVKVSQPRESSDGYLIAEARCVRTGIQYYAGAELGVEKDVVAIYRDAQEVFNPESLQSFSHAPITIDHPPDLVTADNWGKLAVGEVSTEARQEDGWVLLPLILKDAKAIKAIREGKRELSAGYTCDLDMTPGTTPLGIPYDGRQTSIRINHLAIVDHARAGSKARIGDDAGNWGTAPIKQPKRESPMPDNLKTVVVGDEAVSTTDEGARAIEKLKVKLADAQKALTDAADTHKAALSTAEAAHAKAIAAKDAEIDDLKGKVLSDEDLNQRVTERAALIDTARKIVADIDVTNLGDADIRKAVVVAKLGDEMKDKPEAYLDARFEILSEEIGRAGPDPFRKAMRDSPPPKANNGETAHQAMVRDMTTAWTGKKEAV